MSDKSISLLLVAVITLIAGCGGPNVYVTRSGKRYHTNRQCISLASSTNVALISKRSAIQRGLSQCNMCNRVLRTNDEEDDAMEDARKRIVATMNCEGSTRYGPAQRDHWVEHGDAWCALNAGYNIELDRRGTLLDIWDSNGKHYTELGQEFPFTLRREWRTTWIETKDTTEERSEPQQTKDSHGSR